MSISAAHASSFFAEIKNSGTVWTIKDAHGYPAPKNQEGKRAQPFWSSKTRAQSVIDKARAYRGFEIVSITLADFTNKWLPGLEQDDILVGVNWSGEGATGYDMFATDVLKNLSA